MELTLDPAAGFNADFKQSYVYLFTVLYSSTKMYLAILKKMSFH